jgi:uncharacterized protein
VNASVRSQQPAEDGLCLACGLCCNGAIFANLQLQPGDDVGRLRLLGLPVMPARGLRQPPHLSQPCAALEGSRCRIYAERPTYCRQFECVLLKSVQAGRTKPAEAFRIVGAARDRAEKVRRLLRTLGDHDEQVALSVRFRRMTARLKAVDLSEETAELYGELTLAVHDLNLLVHEAFYPGPARRKA